MSQLASVGSPPSPVALPFLPETAGLAPEQQLMALMLASQSVLSADAQVSIGASFDEIERMRAQIQDALEKARKAQESSGLWGGISSLLGGDLASLAQLVACVAAVVATNVAAPAVLATVAAAASLAAKHAEELGIPPELAAGIGIAAGVCLVVAGDMSSLVDAASQTVRNARTVETVANIAASSATGAGAATGGVSTAFTARALEHRAGALDLESQSELEHSSIDEALQRLASAVDVTCASLQRTSAALSDSEQSRERIIQSWGGRA